MSATVALPAKTRARKEVSQSYWSLVWWKFRRNRMAVVGGFIVLAMYIACVVLPEFFAPYNLNQKTAYLEARPQVPHFVDAEGRFHLRPFVYGLERQVDPKLQKRIYVIDTSKRYPLYLFAEGKPYKLFGVIPGNRRLFRK